jgi:hypothetical protein
MKAGYANQDEEVVSCAFIAAMQAATAVEPGHRAFDQPAVPTQAAGRLDTAAGNPRDDLSAP